MFAKVQLGLVGSSSPHISISAGSPVPDEKNECLSFPIVWFKGAAISQKPFMAKKCMMLPAEMQKVR
jgi:hypothetical protein